MGKPDSWACRPICGATVEIWIDIATRLLSGEELRGGLGSYGEAPLGLGPGGR